MMMWSSTGPTRLVGLYVLAQCKHNPRIDISPQPISLCPFSLMLRA